MKIIGLTGKARAGKDTAAGFILQWCEDQGLSAERLAFADPLKLSAAAALGFDIAPRPGLMAEAVAFCDALKVEGATITYDYPAEQGGGQITGREFLQLYGTEAHRDVFGSEFWVEVTEKKLAERAGALDVVVLTDCRFPNEAAMVNQRGGEVWEIDRPNNDSLKDGLEAHSSETGLPDGAIEFCIANVGDRDDLRAMVRSVCEANIDRKGA